MRLAQAEHDLQVEAVVAEPEAAECVDPQVDESKDAVGQPLLEPQMKRQQRAEDRKGEHHLVRDLGVNDPSRLTQRELVDVLDAPRRGRR